MNLPTLHLAVSIGCPCGVGPEVSLVAARLFCRDHPEVRITLHGDLGALDVAARWLRDVGAAPVNLDVVAASELSADERIAGKPGVSAGRAQLAAIDAALGAVLSGSADALVTGPVSKRCITDAGVDFRGHTEYLAARTNTPRAVMLFAGPRLRVALVTTHLSIADVPRAVTRIAVAETLRATALSLRDDFGFARPRVAVAGLNPHAGDGGLLGTDELDRVGPAIDDLRHELGEGFELTGPVPAEAVFRQARDGRFDGVVAMYHDQATIASKLLDFGDAVNVTLGLPFVRTSVDHGTAYDIAGRGTADARGMRAALDLARSMALERRARRDPRLLIS